MGRLYFSDREGPRRLSIAVVASATLYIPFCVYEMVMGKDWFLRSFLFRIPTGGDYRLGGWRPLVMLTNGLELVSWMSLSTVMATWLWACRERWQRPYLPAWLPPIALLLTTIACRGIYGYVILTLGLSAIGLILLTRSRWVLVPFLLVPVLYVGLRSTGLWDARILVSMAGLLGDREVSSVGLRLTMEDQFIKESLGHDLIFGLGGRYADSWADGWWLILLKRGGLLALASHYATFLLPAVLFLFRRSTRSVVASAAAGLALFLILHMIDSLHNTPLIAVSTLLGGSLTGFYLGEAGWSRTSGRSRTQSRSRSEARVVSAEPGHATYRVGDLESKPVKRPVESLGSVFFVLATACVLYVFGHARVEGQEPAKFVGGMGSALLFASVGAVVAGSARRSLWRVIAFGLAFGALGITFNLALHPTTRPVWSADILQGMALAGVVVAAWRRITGGGPWADALLVAVSSSWWVFEPFARAWPGSQYLFAKGSPDGLSLFPVLPWLTLSALGAWLFEVSVLSRLTIALGLGILAAIGWSLGPVKFPLNPIYAMAGGSLASAVFGLAEWALRSAWVRSASEWLGRRWLVFFYLHLGIAPVLERIGLIQPFVVWPALALLSIASTWLISWIMSRLRSPFLWPATWVILFASTLAVGFLPGLPSLVVVAIAGGIGLLLASRLDDLAALILGPTLDGPSTAPSTLDGWSRDLAKLAMVVAVLVAPEALSRLPKPFGQAPRPDSRPPSVTTEVGSTSQPIGQPGDL
jgi:hypothetical protein